MDKFIYRLDLTQDEFDLIKEQLDEKLLSKIKQIKVSAKKTDSMRRATFHRSEIARARFFDALIDLNELDIEVTQYNLKKHKNIPYHTSKKYLDMFELSRQYSKEFAEIPKTYTEEELAELNKCYEGNEPEYLEMVRFQKDMLEYEKSLLEQWANIKARKDDRKKK